MSGTELPLVSLPYPMLGDLPDTSEGWPHLHEISSPYPERKRKGNSDYQYKRL